jgi:monoamine oxidase
MSTPGNSIYTLAMFTAAKDWDTLFNSSLPTLQRQAAVLNDLARIVGEMFGEEKTALVYDVMEYRGQDWYRMAYIEGAPMAATGPGEFGKLAPVLREVVWHVHFGGAETAGEWKGYMEGAIEAGERAAAEVVVVLKNGTG